jgi:predicted phosphodiesterase
MRIALCSDIHGNLSALEAVLADLPKRGAMDAVVCAGDMVYLGPVGLHPARRAGPRQLHRGDLRRRLLAV